MRNHRVINIFLKSDLEFAKICFNGLHLHLYMSFEFRPSFPHLET